RDDLMAFHRMHWRPSRMVIAVSGDVRAAEVVQTLDGLLGDWRDAPGSSAPPSPPATASSVAAPQPAAPPLTAPSPLPPPPAAGIYLRDWPGPQAKVALGHRGPTRQRWDDPDEAALQVLAEVLGGDGAVSRLRRRLRAQEGLVYRTNARLTLGLEGPGKLQVFLEADARHAARALALARAELLRLRDEAVPPVELELAKRSLLDLMPLLFDSAERRAGRFAEDELLGRPHSYWASYRRRLAAVTAADVQRAARRHLRPQELVAVIVGDRAALLAGAAADGVDLERQLGPLHALPRRDPASLEPLP
ncbi:MAG TPA: insulinase family protein, partial [Thermoanaerobaculia bacterium]|nr:insulinase family protein [Thermoanaerobaculia bacterium]